MPFTQFHLQPELLRGIKELGFQRPTPIQVDAIPPAMSGKDVLACAMTGSGKSAAFLLPILHRLMEKKPRRVTRALVLTPTRELAAQIGESFRTYGRHLRLRQTVIFGGVGQQPQVDALARGVHILIATPGRLLDLMNQRHVRLDAVEIDAMGERARQAERSLGTLRSAPRSHMVEGRPAWMIRMTV